MNFSDSFLARVSALSTRRLLLARAAWVLVATAAIVFFGAGIPVFVDNLQWQYAANFDLGWQRNAAGEVITRPGERGQAAQAGILERDVLVAVDDRPVPAGAEITDIIPAGDPGTTVTLQLRTGDRPPREVTLVRGNAEGRLLARYGVPLAAVIAFALGMELLVAAGFMAVALFLFSRRGQERSVWVASLALIVVFVGTLSLPTQALYLAELTWQIWLDAWISLALGTLLLFLFLFPGGHFVPRWTAVVMVAWLLWAVAAWFVPEFYFWRLPAAAFIAGTGVWLLVGMAAQIWRYRYVSTGRQRQQTKWIVWGSGGAVTAIFVQFTVEQFLTPSPLLFDLLINPLGRLVQLLIPLTLIFAIFQRRLWDIDLIFNRTLVYSALSFVIVATYALLVGTLGVLFQAQGSFFFALLATGLIAVLFQPVRQWLQQAVNRLMFGERDDPYAVLSKLTQRLQTTATPEMMLQSVVETVAATLSLPYVAVELVEQEGRLAGAATGKAPAETIERPLRYQNETVGYLVVSSRSPGEAFTRREEQLLSDIAAQTGAMAYSVRLTAALQRSRERLVLAREEERRRIRRDLHDGLGPTLASQTFAFDAILELLDGDAKEAGRLLRGLKAQNQETVAEIRRLVYELRPPALDELGLLGALETQAAQLGGARGLAIRVKTHPEPLPPLSAAVEVAAYRIAVEAMTNVARHAQAQRCVVQLEGLDDSLWLEVTDDGVGLPARMQPGVGLNSMRERAEELGGHLEVLTQATGGTRVRAVLPLAR